MNPMGREVQPFQIQYDDNSQHFYYERAVPVEDVALEQARAKSSALNSNIRCGSRDGHKLIEDERFGVHGSQADGLKTSMRVNSSIKYGNLTDNPADVTISSELITRDSAILESNPNSYNCTEKEMIESFQSYNPTDYKSMYEGQDYSIPDYKSVYDSSMN